MIRLAILGMIGVLVLASCGDTTSPPTPQTPGTYVVSKAGSYFVHDNVFVKMSVAGVPSDSMLANDSTVVDSALTLDGRSAVRSFAYVGGDIDDTVYSSQDGAKVSEYFPIQVSMFGATVDLGAKWVQTFDENASSWTALTDMVPPFNALDYVITAKLNFTGVKDGTESIMINDSSVLTTKSKITIAAVLYVQIAPGVIVPMNISLIRTYWFAKDVGVVKVVQEPSIFDASPLAKTGIPGSRQTVLRYKIAS